MLLQVLPPGACRNSAAKTGRPGGRADEEATPTWHALDEVISLAVSTEHVEHLPPAAGHLQQSPTHRRSVSAASGVQQPGEPAAGPESRPASVCCAQLHALGRPWHAGGRGGTGRGPTHLCHAAWREGAVHVARKAGQACRARGPGQRRRGWSGRRAAPGVGGGGGPRAGGGHSERAA